MFPCHGVYGIEYQKFRIIFGDRAALGALAGMTVGWFLKPEDISALGSISPMALSFLMGYNVEVLFSLMDKINENFTKIKTAGQSSGEAKPG